MNQTHQRQNGTNCRLFLFLFCFLFLPFLTGKENFTAADVSGTCWSNVTGYTCGGHGHAWETPSACGTCGGDHKIDCSACGGTGGKTVYGCSKCTATSLSNKNFVHSVSSCKGLVSKKTVSCTSCGGTGGNSCSRCYASGTYRGKNTRCANASWSGCGKGGYAAWSDFINGSGVCYTDNCTPLYGSHQSSNTYAYDSVNHWSSCIYCGGTMGTAAHSYGNEYTSGGYRYQNCGCGYVRNNGPVSYSIAYHGNGADGGSTASSVHSYDNAAGLSGNGYYRTGYTFLGWSLDAGASVPSYHNGQTVANLTHTHGSVVNLYAVWQADSYTVSLHANGGTNGSLSSVTAIYGTSNYYAHGGIVPSRSGHTFLGWFDAPDGGSAVYNASGICVNGTGYWSNNCWTYAGNVTLYAHWQRNAYTVSYSGNGGSATAGSRTVYYGDRVDLTGVRAAKDGMIFTGWNTDPNAKTPLQTLSMPAGNVTLYAIYSIPVSDVEGVYLVAWPSGNTAAARTIPLSKTAAQELLYTYGISNANLSAMTGQGNNAYALIAYDNAGNYSILKQSAAPPSLKPYVQTVNHYRYDAILGDWVWFDTTSDLKLYGETFTPAYLSVLPQGYAAHSIGGTYTVTGNKTSNAYYKPVTCQVFFNPNGGTVSPSSKSVVYQDVYGELPTPKRTGYDFTGWYTHKSAGTRVVSSTIYETAGNTTLYAHWNIHVHNVIYDYHTNGGNSVSKESMRVSYGSPADLSVTAGKHGWTFVGWNTNPDAKTGLSSIRMGDEDLTLYAIYKKNITASFVDLDNARTRTAAITIYNRETGCQMPVPEIGTLAGWTALGWSTDSSAAAVPTASGGGTYPLSGNAVFYACYTQNLTIRYDTNGSSQKISSQSKPRYFNASGSYKNPSFTLADAPKLDRHSFVCWEAADEHGIQQHSYGAKQDIVTDKNLFLSAKWDRYPELEAYDRYFTLEDAASGKITAERLFEKVTASDREDGTLLNGKDVIIPNLTGYDFVNNPDSVLTYQAKDSFGNITEKSITIHVVDTTVTESPIVYDSRFINPKFFKNDTDYVSSEIGGLESTSIWITNPVYERLLSETLNRKNAKYTYSFCFEELGKLRNTMP